MALHLPLASMVPGSVLSPDGGEAGSWLSGSGPLIAGGVLLLALAALGWSLVQRRPSAEAAAGADAATIGKAAGLIEIELSKVLGLLRARISSDQAYGASLAGAQERLANLPTSEQVRVILTLLVDENQRMRVEAAKTAKDLEASRQHIDTLRSSLEKAQEVGLRDALTGVGNRRCFDLVLEDAIKAATATRTPLAVVMGDIDHFKKINDEFGHQVGDEVLKVFSRLLGSNVRERDTVTRYGGEEFAIILVDANVQNAAMIAERIRAQFNSKNLSVRKTGQEIGARTASFGVTQLVAGERAESLMRRADNFLYEAKKAGRNLVVSDLGRLPRSVVE